MFWMTRCVFLSIVTVLSVGAPITYAMGSPPVETAPEIHEKKELSSPEKTQISFTEDGVLVGVSSAVPESISHAFTMYSPEQNTITFSDKILIKGVNRYLTDVFVNNTKVTLRKDGRFFYDAPLSKIGRNIVWVSLISPDFKVTTIPFVVTRLKSVEGETSLTSAYTLMANSDYVDTTSKVGLKTPLTREAFAEAIFAYKADISESKRSVVDSKNPKVAHVVDAGFMTTFPDGSFKPDQSVKMVDYIVGVVRLLNLDIKKYATIDLPYQDITMDHWTTPYVQALYKEGLLPSANSLQLGQTLTFQTFTDYWVRLPEVERTLQSIASPKSPAFFQEDIKTAVSATVVHVNLLRTEIAKSRRLELLSPAEGTIVYTGEILIRGRVFPVEKLEINHQPLVPSADGSFSLRLNLDKPGTHAVRITSSFATVARMLTYTPGYADMAGHWAGNTAAKFAQLGWVFDKSPMFLPHKVVTRLELARLFDTVFTPSETTANVAIKDISEDNNAPVQRILSQGWMSLHQGLFLGDVAASKAEVAIVLRRALAITTPDTFSSSFGDVPETHWAARDLAALVSANIVTPGGQFSPSRAITRAELIALLAKVPSIKTKLESVQP